MRRFKYELEQEISTVFSNFLHEQLGEHAASVTTFLSGNMFTVRADDCLPPGEQRLAQNEKHWDLLQKVKVRQFEKVESILKKQMERVCDCKILNIYSIVAQDGVRFEIFTLSENIEDTLLKTEAES